MTVVEIRAAIETTLGRVPFVAPLAVPYCQAVRDDLRAALPPGSSVEVYYVPSRFIVNVAVAGVPARYELALR